MKRLGVNIDHIATLRNARGEIHPNPVQAAKLAIRYGADSITLHLREDRRHIRDKDLLNIVKIKNIPINLEIAATNQMLNIAIKHKPNYVCIVPENRKEITTEGGLNLDKNKKLLKKIINKLNKKSIRTSLFINPKISDIKKSKKLGAKCIELHTGKFCRLINLKKNYKNEFNKIKKCSYFANLLGIEVHAGHGLTYSSAIKISKIKSIKEFNIGHFLVGESLLNGMNKTILKFKRILI